jgi:hypothetical protein
MTLCKYYAPDSVELILLPNKGVSLRLSQPKILNDIFDSNIGYNGVNEENKNHQVKTLKRVDFSDEKIEEMFKIINSKDQKKMHQSLYDSVNKKYGICSLAQNDKSQNMWAYYAKDHQGFMIFFKDDSNLNLDSNIFDLEPVTYLSVRPKYDFDLTKKPTFLTIKDPSWEPEDELRIIAKIDQLTPNDEPDPNGVLVYTVIIDCSQIQSITLGARASTQLRDTVKDWISGTAQNVKLYQSEPSIEKFELVYNEIENRHTLNAKQGKRKAQPSL